MQTYKVKLLEKKEIAERTFAFHFEKPEHFEFHAGQYCNWTLVNPKEEGGESSHHFSLTTAPHEKYIGLATRVRDSIFKKNLTEMNPGDLIEVSDPMGSYTLPNKTENPIVFLIGGIGITPVRSMILDSLVRKTGHLIYLFLSNRRPEDAPFLKEFELWQSEYFKFIPTMTKPQESKEKWTGETGYITPEMIKRHLMEGMLCTYYLSGPAEMVGAMRTLLVGMN